MRRPLQNIEFAGDSPRLMLDTVRSSTQTRARMGEYQTEQEAFWAGHFGDEYAGRNQGAGWLASNLALFSTILRRTRDVRSVLEMGANIGLNLEALHQLLPDAELSAVEINPKASDELARRLPQVQLHRQSLLEFTAPRRHDLVLIKGVLIHIHPDRLARAYESLVGASARYLCLAEYYSPQPVSLPYRGHQDRLFKRDFAGELLDRFPELRLIDYGFVYRRDPHFPQDDLTWFLLEKGS